MHIVHVSGPALNTMGLCSSRETGQNDQLREQPLFAAPLFPMLIPYFPFTLSPSNFPMEKRKRPESVNHLTKLQWILSLYGCNIPRPGFARYTSRWPTFVATNSGAPTVVRGRYFIGGVPSSLGFLIFLRISIVPSLDSLSPCLPIGRFRYRSCPKSVFVPESSSSEHLDSMIQFSLLCQLCSGETV